MKKMLPTLLAFSLIFSNSLAQAGEYDRGHKNSHGDRGKNKHVQNYTHHNAKRHSDQRRNHHAYHKPHAHQKPHYKERSRRHHSHRNKAGYILGGMFLGAVANEFLSPRKTVVKERVYVERDPYVGGGDQVFLRDDYGTCYRVEQKRHGKVLTQVSNYLCSAY